MSGHEYGKQMKYPYTLTAKFLNFPFKFYWKNGRGIRFVAYGLALSYPIFYQIHKAVNSPGNIEHWKQIRQNRHHDVFARPSE